MKKIALILALLLIFSLLASCNEGDTPPEVTTTAVTTTAATTTTAVQQNKYTDCKVYHSDEKEWNDMIEEKGRGGFIRTAQKIMDITFEGKRYSLEYDGSIIESAWAHLDNIDIYSYFDPRLDLLSLYTTQIEVDSETEEVLYFDQRLGANYIEDNLAAGKSVCEREQCQAIAEKFIKEYAQSFRDLSPKWKENPPRVGNFLRTQTHQTAHGAVTIYGIVADIYYQIDPTFPRTEKYSEEYEFSLDVLPGYLAGGISAENYVSQYILPKYPSTMKKGERKRLVKEEIKLAFQRECKGFPRWIQMPEWPIGSDNKPMIYLGQKAFDHHSEYYFRDSTTNEKYTVTQSW